MNIIEWVKSSETNLISCDREAIHIPGAIQPHGILLVLKEPELIILQSSKNTQELLGIDCDEIINQKLDKILKVSQIKKIQSVLNKKKQVDVVNQISLLVQTPDKGDTFLDGIIHRYNGVVILELEQKYYQSSKISFSNFYYLIRNSTYKLQSALNFEELIEFVVKEVRKITGFDRVMVYKFDKEMNGEVIAEDKQKDLESYLGLHYPAMDIPKQARKLYTLNCLRLIPDTNYQSIAIFPTNNPITNQPLDLSLSVLRSVSPVHIEYLKNMGVRATLSMSLIKDQKLWGLIACHHYLPKFVSYELRKACEFISQVMSVELVYKEHTEINYYYLQGLKKLKNNIIQSMTNSKNFLQGLVKEPNSLLNLVNAEGGVVCWGDNCTLLGKTPTAKNLKKLTSWLKTNINQEVFYTDSLAKIYPESENFKDIVSGLLVITINLSQKSYQVVWFRPEFIHTVNWGGNPKKIVKIYEKPEIRLSPRKSFELWKETVKLTSYPWQEQEIDVALELRSAIMLAALESSQEELRQSKELAQVTLKSIGDAVITTDAEGRIEGLNPIAEKLTGWSMMEARGLPVDRVFSVIKESTRLPIENQFEKAINSGMTFNIDADAVLIAKDGSEYAIDDSVAPIRNLAGEIIGAVLVFRDVTQERYLANQLLWQASHDQLTSLVNRHQFERELEQLLKLRDQKHNNHALCYLDLDQFKIVNDTCGHVAGDELLRQVSNLLESKVGKNNTLARLGGDEFGLLLHNIKLETAKQIANSLREEIMNYRFIWEEKVFRIGVSIGLVSIDSSTQEDLASVLSAADAACYAAKNLGRNRVHVYQVDDNELVRQRNQIEWAVKIPQALEDNSFCLYYQSIIPLIATDSVWEHREILLRLQDSSGKIISPMAFIPAAERYNLMNKIDRWVVSHVFAYLEQCFQQVKKLDCVYTINLSGDSINDEMFVEFLYQQFDSHQIRPQIICFEVTETLAIANLKKAEMFIRSLKELGCKFALDDFGSGMSSFGYLRNLPVDYIKIDGSFIKDMVDNPINCEIVEAINRIGDMMGMETIAEFVENEAILEKLQEIGVDYAQGYGIARPKPLIN
ncbi:EAL domain-containing protein [Okeania sp. SIO2B3]|uniref:EAL domain-containing protein n=1 Tax=Okeania sp. SIO2B3 TaxID=2607784 RepID=UPI0013C0229E|nr:EAL domain-containing protein [Okeania sp. SIO2B3]NET45176.1 EAL domain-containing protein [Okeania sp. SIO2B3]